MATSIELSTNVREVLQYPIMELIQTRSGIFLAGNNDPGVAGALLFPRIWPKLQHPFASVSEEGWTEASNAQT